MLTNYRPGYCYVIAEIGGNFIDFPQAKTLLEAAKACGVDAVKLQTFRAETLSTRSAMFDMENTGHISQFEMFEKYQIGRELHAQVFDLARSLSLDCFSTPSHVTDLDLLDELGVSAYKVGSDDGVNLPFLRELGRRGKPILLSTGMCTLEEVRESVDAILAEGNENIILLHAITSYPTHAKDVNLLAMRTLMEAFPRLPVGYSDHTLGFTASLCAAAMGAAVVEKHFTWDKGADGPDHMHSADPDEMRAVVERIREFEAMRGSGIKRPADAERTTRRNNRKSVVTVAPVAAGEVIGMHRLDVKRPGTGIGPKHLEMVAGRRANRDLPADTVLSWEDIG